MKKKFFSAILSFVLAASAIACAKPVKPDDDVDTTKTQLYLGNYNGGVGTEWLEKSAARFSEKYKDTCFEPGTDKKGVQIHIDPDKDKYHGSNLKNNLSSLTEQIIFTERANYDTYVSSGKILEMTDVVKGSLSEFGESETIENKMGKNQREFLNKDGKYYAVPHYRLFSGIQYNVRLWQDEGYYFAADGESFVTPGSTAEEEPRSKGPDGKANTADDGLPATYDDFFKLCDYICESGNVPFVWTGQYLSQYTGFLYWALYADYEGEKLFTPNFTFSGEVNDIVTGFDASGNPILSTVNVTRENGYELRRQAGRYYALSFLERLIAGNKAKGYQYYTDKSFGLTYSNLSAQEDFIKSYYENKPIAMIAEGSWWQNEADGANGAFSTAVQSYGQSASRDNSEFGFMPLPKATKEKVGEPTVTVDVYDSYIFFNSNLKGNKDLIDLATLFVKFICTDAEMIEFTKTTGLPRALEYEMGGNVSALNRYEKDIWRANSENVVILPYSADKLYRNNVGTLCYTYDWETTVNDKPYSIPVKAMKDNGITALQYFNGMQMSKTDWDNLYSRYF